MKTRLNITIEENLLNKVKMYANKHDSSVSQLVEEYFETLIKKPERKSVIDLIEELPKPKDKYPPGFDFLKGYYKARAKKYGF
jgi:chromatin segregation and condensation protein Rec8/ScpA/Scc1 (kleisin family)